MCHWKTDNSVHNNTSINLVVLLTDNKYYPPLFNVRKGCSYFFTTKINFSLVCHNIKQLNSYNFSPLSPNGFEFTILWIICGWKRLNGTRILGNRKAVEEDLLAEFIILFTDSPTFRSRIFFNFVVVSTTGEVKRAF